MKWWCPWLLCLQVRHCTRRGVPATGLMRQRQGAVNRPVVAAVVDACMVTAWRAEGSAADRRKSSGSANGGTPPLPGHLW